LILLDVNMPDMNGYEVCQSLKGDDQTRHIPIIFISALSDVEDKVRAFTIGGVDYIAKPFQLEEVLARVQTHLALRQLQEELQQANEALEQRVAQRTAELVQLNAALERFVPREFLGFLGKNSITQVELGDQVQAEMTILFSDIRDFTPRSERLTPQQNFFFVNDYLGCVGPIIRQHHGLIDKYLGDGVMALFPGAADDAVLAAIAMQREVASHNCRLLERDEEPISIGVGLHTGRMMLGIIGEEQRWQGTVISDAVNLADRLEDLTKVYGVSIVVSEQTLARLHNPAQFNCRFLDRAQVKGKRELIPVFEILEGDPDTMALKLQTKPAFEAGLHLFYDRKFAEASVRFNQVIEHNPADKAARLYLQRAARFMVQGVPADWDGAGLPEDMWPAMQQD
ncbi:MAG: response regulator, partial [Chloroflexi bacterium]|nr:response regulator [Chloroflexota bacterium]